MTRKEERELAFTLIFEKIFNDELSVDEVIENAVEARLIEENTYAFSVAHLTYEHLEEIDKLITDNSIGWSLTRLPRCLLQYSVLLFVKFFMCHQFQMVLQSTKQLSLQRNLQRKKTHRLSMVCLVKL